MHYLLIALSIVILLSPFNTQAQNNLDIPELPAPIQNLKDEGAQVRFLGRERGLDGWIAIKQGQEQYFYVMPDGKSFVMGLLFDESGEVITVDQVQKLQAKEGDVLDALADDLGLNLRENPAEQAQQFRTPSEQLFYDVENTNWVALGNPSAPVMYAFIDPQCPHCHEFIKDVRGDIDAGKLQLRMVLVGFRDASKAQAAFLLASPNPQKRWFEHMDGQENVLPIRQEINQQGVERNVNVMTTWKFNATPMVVYRSKGGAVKIVRGRPQNVPGLLADLGVSG